MKWNHNRQEKYKQSFFWHKWYAWHPVSDGNTIVWLDWVWRKRTSSWYECWWKYNFSVEQPLNTDLNS